jgi:hypothetical protein
MLRDSTQPRSRSPATSASQNESVIGVRGAVAMNPMRRIVCCAPAANGAANTAPRPVTKARRFIGGVTAGES